MTHMPLSRLCGLALRQLLRDIRASEVRVLFFALLVAVAASTAIGYFGARLNGAMQLRASEFLGADLVLQGSAPARDEQISAGKALGLRHAQVVEFTSVVGGDAGIQLSSIKAADGAYPLRGQVRSAAAPYAEETPGGGPAPGEAWVEPRLLAALGLSVGDSIDVGMKTLRMSRVLTYEPDRANNFYSLTPRVMMNLTDLQATGVIQPGSRVSYRDLWRGEAQPLAQYREGLQKNLAANQRLLDTRDGNRQIGGALGKAERYLNMASLVAVLLAGVAVAMSASRYAARRLDASALLRCLGLSRHQALGLYCLNWRCSAWWPHWRVPWSAGWPSWACSACCMGCCQAWCRPAESCRHWPVSPPAWLPWPASPCRRSQPLARCRHCAYCAVTCCRRHPAAGWCMAPPCWRWA